MLLSKLYADPARFQMRGKPFSENTVAGIVAEGINLAKFDPIPIVLTADGRHCVAGDGHSRYEAIRQLADLKRLPFAWNAGTWPNPDFDIPCRVVTEAEARKLSRTANLARDNFTAPEEARVYRSMIDADGMTVEQVAAEAHKDPAHVRRMLKLNDLAACILEHVGRPMNAGGVTRDAAVELAEHFTRYGVSIDSQQQLWNKVLSKLDLTPQTVRGMRLLFERIAGVAREKQDALFTLPPNIDAVIVEVKERAALLARAQRNLTGLLSLIETGILDAMPPLKNLLALRGEEMLAQLKYEATADGAAVGGMVLCA